MGVQEPESKVLQVSSGKPFTIHLWEDRTRGEQWVPAYEPTEFMLIDDEFLRTTSNNAVDSGQRSFEFQPIKLGTHRVEIGRAHV